MTRVLIDRRSFLRVSAVAGGGLIGMIMAGFAGSIVRNLVINDIGPFVSASGLKRIGQYIGSMPASFPTLDAADAYIRTVLAPYGDLSDAQWRHLARHSVRWNAEHQRYDMLCDPAIAKGFRSPWFYPLNLWAYWEAITVPVLVLHGARSDLLSFALTQEMKKRNRGASVFSFDDGVTGIVGPNGCGKSNVVDSIRWVMGEQSAKNLRGRGMEDVIFNGSETKAPLSMAEVSLTFHVDDTDQLAPQYQGFPEITVTRRLFRSGESEYLINKTVCRLLDITELFLGTGVGTRAYSIIEQGRVARLLDAGVSQAQLSRLHSPIGLDLGARTPEETAISIAAEITAARWGGTGKPLRDSAGRIHHDRLATVVAAEGFEDVSPS